MSITVRGTASGPNNNSTTTSISLPTGTTTGDVTILGFVQASSGPLVTNGLVTFTPPSGWTVIYNSGTGFVLCWRAFQSGDPTSGITCTSSVTNWWGSVAITYTGLDTTNPVDAFNYGNRLSTSDTFNTVQNVFLAPSLNPNYNGSQLLIVNGIAYSSGGTINQPSGTTSRVSFSGGPSIRFDDVALSTGANTGDYSTTFPSARAFQYFSAQVALKASGAASSTAATARPTIAGCLYRTTKFNTTMTANFDWLEPSDGDLMAVFAANEDGSHPSVLLAAPSGWTTQTANASGMVFTKTWHTGDTKTPGFTLGTASTDIYFNVGCFLFRKVGTSSNGVVVDSFNQNTYSGTGTSQVGTAPSEVPATSVDVLMVMHGVGSAASITWSSVTGGLTDDIVSTGSGGNARASHVVAPANPTGSFNATATLGTSGAYTMSSMTMLIKVGAAGGAAVAIPVVLFCT